LLAFFSNNTKDLPQLDNGIKISPKPEDWVCADSGLRENLWLNLSTGYIGSGRQNFDGSGGTGAALKYFEATGSKYPLVVKLGTITAQGADVYSYAPDENDAVIDPLLGEHLAHWGIDVMQQRKTEKTTDELSIALNKDHQFGGDRICESGKELQQVTGAGCIGMQNIGNSCYMNSVMQVLHTLPEVRARFAHNFDRVYQQAKGPTDVETQLCKLGISLQDERFSGMHTNWARVR
jgi:ubiquitin carboxyl-terminal hydrolase 5/13